MDIKKLRDEALKEVLGAKNLEELEKLEIKYLGRKGILTEVLKQLKELSSEVRIQVGASANQLKHELSSTFERRKKEIKAALDNSKEWVDISAPGHKLAKGHLNPRTIVLRKVEEIFQSLGFSVIDSSEMETDYYNFQALNFPKDHPARDMQDTFYLTDELLMRTQTSPNQVRFMEKHNPPLRVIVNEGVVRSVNPSISCMASLAVTYLNGIPVL